MIKNQRGVTLIELMIGMVLGLSLVAGIGSLFIQSQKSFRLQQNSSDMTDDATFVLETLAKGILLAGYSEDSYDFNCVKNTVENINPVTDEVTKTTDSTTCDHIKSVQTNVLGSGLDLNCVNTLTETTSCTPTTTPSCSVVSTSKTHIKTTETKCEIIKGTNTALIYRFVLADLSQLNNSLCTTNSNALGDTVLVNLYQDTNRVLYCQSTSAAQPITSEVEKLEFRYGVRVKKCETKDIPALITEQCEPSLKRKPELDTFYYTKAENVTDWTNVFSIKIYLVMRSVDDNLTRTKLKYKIEDVEMTATDNRLYKVFTKTIYLRTVDNS